AGNPFRKLRGSLPRSTSGFSPHCLTQTGTTSSQFSGSCVCLSSIGATGFEPATSWSRSRLRSAYHIGEKGLKTWAIAHILLRTRAFARRCKWSRRIARNFRTDETGFRIGLRRGRKQLKRPPSSVLPQQRGDFDAIPPKGDKVDCFA